jgi:polyhydroxyalkanoate synthesis regulator phasin
MSVDKKTTGEPTQDQKITMLKNQVNNIDIVGKILVEEGKIIEEFMKSNQIVAGQNHEEMKKKLANIAVALGVAAKYFEGKITGLENEIKKLTDK